MEVLDFRSDNTATVAREYMEAMAIANDGTADGYGRDPLTKRLSENFSIAFETEVNVHVTATGTAANAIALSALVQPWEAVICHESSHINSSECGAPEFFAGGVKLLTLSGPHGRIRPSDLESYLENSGRGKPHRVQPAVLSITQPTDLGTVYSLGHLQELSEVARQYDLRIHMDGARIANALVTLDCSFADISWKSGVDLLSLGVTKNGGMSADAIVSFDHQISEQLLFRLRRAGQTFSKMRFASAQLHAFLKDDLYRRLATRANSMAKLLAEGLTNIDQIEFVEPVEANEIFLKLPENLVRALKEAGLLCVSFPGGKIRLVTRWDTNIEEIDGLIELFSEVCETKVAS